MKTERVQVNLPVDLHERVKAESKARRITKIQWMIEATRAKLAGAEDADARGILQGLDDTDRRRVQEFADFLRVCTDDMKDACDTNLGILKRFLRSMEIDRGERNAGSKRGRRKGSSTSQLGNT